jgi:hypothetical protein
MMINRVKPKKLREKHDVSRASIPRPHEEIEYLSIWALMVSNDCALKILSGTRFGLVTRFIDHFTTRLRTTSNYSAIANLHALHITAANTKSSSAYSVFTSRFLVTDYTSWDPSASTLKPFQAGHRLTTELSQSQSHIATDGHSVSKSWCRTPSGDHDQIFITI